MTHEPADPAAAPERRQGETGSPAVRRIRSTNLFREFRELIILHNGGEYHLRITRSGKLILTK